MTLTIRQIIAELHQQLAGQYPQTEIESFARILFGHYLKMTPLRMHLLQDDELPDEAVQQIRAAIADLRKNRPIQYILGVTEFCGLKFEVTPDVLIPRPETEELVDWVVRQYDRDVALSLLDIGTGSGCIAVALAAAFRNACVWAVDISEAALTVALRNARANHVKIAFLLGDILNRELSIGFPPESLDVIVSNPPYIMLSEQQQIMPNVLDYEPHQALFAPDDDLIFYERMAALGMKCLKPHGKIFFEINEAFPEKVADILQRNNYSDITARKDINGKWRMVSAQK